MRGGSQITMKQILSAKMYKYFLDFIRYIIYNSTLKLTRLEQDYLKFEIVLEETTKIFTTIKK
jgi:hypothetical protein